MSVSSILPINLTNTSIVNGTQNTALPSDFQLQNEMLGKVSSSGQMGNFTQSTVTDTTNVIPTVNNLNTQAQSRAVQDNIAASSPSSSGGQGTTPYTTNDLVVTISSAVNTSDKVQFTVSPTIAETRTANYTAADILHHPGAMQIYRSTAARTWNITAMIVSRTAAEAQSNLEMINLIRSWVMPYYGAGTEKDEKSNGAGSRFGAPPDILMLKAYGPSMIGPVPTVLASYSWTWPNEVTYIKATNGNPFPVILSVTLDLTEAYSPLEYSNFTLSKYKSGQLDLAFPVTSKVAGR